MIRHGFLNFNFVKVDAKGFFCTKDSNLKATDLIQIHSKWFEMIPNDSNWFFQFPVRILSCSEHESLTYTTRFEVIRIDSKWFEMILLTYRTLTTTSAEILTHALLGPKVSRTPDIPTLNNAVTRASGDFLPLSIPTATLRVIRETHTATSIPALGISSQRVVSRT